MCSVVFAPPPQSTLQGPTDDHECDRDPEQEDDHVQHNRRVHASALGRVSCTVREWSCVTVGFGASFLVGGKNDPAEEIEDRQGDGDNNGGGLGGRVVDDPWHQVALAPADEERGE